MGASGGAAPGAGRRRERIKEFEEDEVDIMEGPDQVDPARLDEIEAALFK